MPLELNNANVAVLGRLALDSYIGDSHDLAIGESMRGVIALCSEKIASDLVSVGALIRLGDTHYRHNIADRDATHEEALEAAAVIVAMACNQGKITNWLQPYAPKR